MTRAAHQRQARVANPHATRTANLAEKGACPEQQSYSGHQGREGPHQGVGYSSTGFFQKDRMTAPTTEPTMMATSHITGLPMTGSTQAPPWGAGL